MWQALIHGMSEADLADAQVLARSVTILTASLRAGRSPRRAVKTALANARTLAPGAHALVESLSVEPLGVTSSLVQCLHGSAQQPALVSAMMSALNEWTAEANAAFLPTAEHAMVFDDDVLAKAAKKKKTE